MRIARFVPIALLLLFVASPSAFAQFEWGRPHAPRSGACFYRDFGFRGDYFCLKDGERWPSLPRGFNDSISSIRVFGGARLRVFNDVNFGGPNMLVDHNIDNLKRIPSFPGHTWNDRISAIAVFRDRDEWAGPRRDARDGRY